MKKIFLLLFTLCSLSLAVRLGDLELSPEFGGGAQRLMINGKSHYEYSLYGKVWVGVNDLVIAPQFKYSSLDDGYRQLKNQQYGASVGLNIELAVLYLTPYLGANYSSFNEYYESTVSFNAGLRAKPMLFPLTVGVEYQYQNPNTIYGRNVKMEAVLFSLGFSF